MCMSKTFSLCNIRTKKAINVKKCKSIYKDRIKKL